MMIRSTTLADYQHSGWLGNRVIFREQVASTNDITLEMAQSGAHEGLVVLADEQTAGRGRLKRSSFPNQCQSYPYGVWLCPD
jgi:BirA family biotin operon repressor/biotin-[acetyl-CoA-carboxylase] ligase